MKITQLKIFRKKWSSQKAFVLSTAAAAVGLGNLWRFPYIAGENGGAAFILAYLICIIVLGVPLMISELGLGKITRGGPVKAFRSLNKKLAGFGWVIIAVTLIIMAYYLVITGWSLNYAVKSLFGVIPSFSEFTSTLEPFIFFLIVVGIAAFVVYRGVRTIEKLSIYLMPVLVLVVLVLTGYAITLDGASQAISFLFEPDFSSLLSPSLWLLAMGQAFYSLAVGQGYLITYGSFLPKKMNLSKSAGYVASIETLIALVAGLMIFPLVFTFGLNPGEGTELAFKTLPLAFNSISIGWLLAIVFFWLLFLAALSSCIAGMEVVKTSMREELKLNHGWATAASFLLMIPLGILSALSFSSAEVNLFGRPFLEILDLFAANQLVIALGVIGGALIGWLVPKQELINSFGNKYRHTASRMVKVIKYLWLVVLAILTLSLIF